jgi:hypothetical protein
MRRKIYPHFPFFLERKLYSVSISVIDTLYSFLISIIIEGAVMPKKKSDGAYSTPKRLAKEMVRKLRAAVTSMSDVEVLIPDAGTGVLIKALLGDVSSLVVDVTEEDPELRAELARNKNVCVVWDHFCSYSPYRRYDGILLDTHDALDVDVYLEYAKTLLKHGGVCVYVENKKARVYKRPGKFEEFEQGDPPVFAPPNPVRGSLLRIDYSTNGFMKKDAFRETLKRTFLNISDEDGNDLYTRLWELVGWYRFSVEAGFGLLREHKLLHRYISHVWENPADSEKVWSIASLPWAGRGWINASPEDYLSAINGKYWSLLTDRLGSWYAAFSGSFTAVACLLKRLRHYEFNVFTIPHVLLLLSKAFIGTTEAGLMRVFEHFLSGTDDNKSKPGKMFIGCHKKEARYFEGEIVVCAPSKDANLSEQGSNWYYLKQTDCLLSLFTGDCDSIRDPSAILAEADISGNTKNIVMNHITVSFCKKGTMKIRFNDPKVLHALNIFYLTRTGALPQDYGRASYESFSKANRKVIDDYEGEEAYYEVYRDSSSYLKDIKSIPVFQPRALLDVLLEDVDKYLG